ncbi:Aste57867_1219 [Aphanomyces stellatus]|uniref:Aste57867_1219 protein n=1 Tax=Aphanomyces stellatus TaxID=120398 RepID=A0A485K8V1_9STRA|nr:hypothetical protein As57867_001218 [Aphanomyces stellatus]VFT78439.1 Aste57867_1219 [Aphanomyces stellatus]
MSNKAASSGNPKKRKHAASTQGVKAVKGHTRSVPAKRHRAEPKKKIAAKKVAPTPSTAAADDATHADNQALATVFVALAESKQSLGFKSQFKLYRQVAAAIRDSGDAIEGGADVVGSMQMTPSQAATIGGEIDEFLSTGKIEELEMHRGERKVARHEDNQHLTDVFVDLAAAAATKVNALDKRRMFWKTARAIADADEAIESREDAMDVLAGVKKDPTALVLLMEEFLETGEIKELARLRGSDDDGDEETSADDQPAKHQDNQDLADAFVELAKHDAKKRKMYWMVAHAILDADDAITCGKDVDGGASKLKPGFGWAMIDEFVSTGQIAKLERFRASKE